MSNNIQRFLFVFLFLSSVFSIKASIGDEYTPEQTIQSSITRLNVLGSDKSTIIKLVEPYVKASLNGSLGVRNNNLKGTALVFGSWVGRIIWDSVDEIDSNGNIVNGQTNSYLYTEDKNKYLVFFLSGVGASVLPDNNIELHGYKLNQSILVFSTDSAN